MPFKTMTAAFISFCYRFVPLFVALLPPATGKPLETGSPGRVFAVHGEDVILPCRSTAPVHPSHVTVVEWLRVDRLHLQTVHVERNGEQLVKEKAPEYRGRTAMLDDGSLKLVAATQQDTGTYRCVLPKGAATKEVSLFVGEVPGVNVTLRRTSANKMFVHWESSGWFLKPHVSLLDTKMREIRVHAESWLGPDDLYSVRAQVDTANGNGTLTFRVEIPGTSARKETQISIIDEFSSQVAVAVFSSSLLWVLFIVLFCVSASVFLFVPINNIEKVRSSLMRLIGDYKKVAIVDPGVNRELPYETYGDITKITLTNVQAEINGYHQLAEQDREKLMTYKESLITVGKRLGVHPALIAAIISRQSSFGTNLKNNGYGKFDNNCYGLMQINKLYHAVKGNAFSEEHLDHGVTCLIQHIKTMVREQDTWTPEQQLKGALACYIAGDDKVIKLPYEDLDSVTPNNNFTNDVVARAQWFARFFASVSGAATSESVKAEQLNGRNDVIA